MNSIKLTLQLVFGQFSHSDTNMNISEIDNYEIVLRTMNHHDLENNDHHDFENDNCEANDNDFFENNNHRTNNDSFKNKDLPENLVKNKLYPCYFLAKSSECEIDTNYFLTEDSTNYSLFFRERVL